MIELIDIGYVRSSTPDLATSVRFAVDVVGMELSASQDDPGARTAYLRCDARQHCLAFVEGPPGLLATGLLVRDLDVLADAERQLELAGVTVTRGTDQEAAGRRLAAFVAFDDPAGNHIELGTDQAVLGRPVEFGRAAGIIEFGHICLDAADPRETAAFWTGVFSARVSDHIGDAAYLLRIDPVHHKLAIFRGDEPGLCHLNMQVDSLDTLMRNWRHLQRAGVEIQSGPGRHPTSGAIFVYFSGPHGMTYEYSYGVALIDEDSWRPRNFPLHEPGSIDMWGGPTQRLSSQPQLGEVRVAAADG